MTWSGLPLSALTSSIYSRPAISESCCRALSLLELTTGTANDCRRVTLRHSPSAPCLGLSEARGGAWRLAYLKLIATFDYVWSGAPLMFRSVQRSAPLLAFVWRSPRCLCPLTQCSALRTCVGARPTRHSTMCVACACLHAWAHCAQHAIVPLTCGWSGLGLT